MEKEEKLGGFIELLIDDEESWLELEDDPCRIRNREAFIKRCKTILEETV